VLQGYERGSIVRFEKGSPGRWQIAEQLKRETKNANAFRKNPKRLLTKRPIPDSMTAAAVIRAMNLESLPVDPALLQSANRWFDISWYGILIAGLLTAVAAAATVFFLFVQFWSGGVKERHTEWRTAELETRTVEANASLEVAQADIANANAKIAAANEGAAKANERAALLEKEAATLRTKLDEEIQKRQWRSVGGLGHILYSDLRGKISEINLVVQKDAEAKNFGAQLLLAFSSAEIKINWYELPAGQTLPLDRLALYVPGDAEQQDPLFMALKKADLLGGTFHHPYASLEDQIRNPVFLPKDIHTIYVGQRGQ